MDRIIAAFMLPPFFISAVAHSILLAVSQDALYHIGVSGRAPYHPAESHLIGQLLGADTDAHGILRIGTLWQMLLGAGADADIHILQIQE